MLHAAKGNTKLQGTKAQLLYKNHIALRRNKSHIGKATIFVN